MTEIHEGGCLCGDVRYRASGPALRTLVCHCVFCQKMTGSSSYAESIFPMDAVAFQGAAMSRYTHVSDTSDKRVNVHFCPRCGTTLALTFERWPQLRAISRGTFDDPNWVCVGSHIWTRSAQTGTALPADTDCFARARATVDGVPELPRRFDAPVMARATPL